VSVIERDLTDHQDKPEETPVLSWEEKEKRRKILDWCNNSYEKCKRLRQPFERQWYLNLAFYFGRQYVQWQTIASTSAARLYEPAAPNWRVRLVSNKCRPIIRNELSKLIKEEPQSYVRPQSTDDTAIAAAQAAENIAEFEMDELHWNRILRNACFWASICGTGFIKDWWDANRLDPSGVMGKIGLEPVNPFHFFVPLAQEQEIENQPYVIHAMAKTCDWVEDTYEVKVNPDTNVSAALLEQQFLNALGVYDNTSSTKYVMVKEAWIKPCGRWPQGCVIIWADNQILSMAEGWPYDCPDYPFSKIESVPSGRFWSDSILVDLIPLQREYNRTRSQIIESKNRMSKPQLLAPKGSVDPTKMTSEPGLVIQYTPGFNPPTPLTLQDIPNYVIQELERIQHDMDDISSQYEIAKGRTPPGVTAASAIAYLQEENDSKLSYATTSIEECTEKVGRHILYFVGQYWDVPRQVRVLGKNMLYESAEFTKSSTGGNVDYRVEPGSAAPRSRAAKQAMIVELGKLGWISPASALRHMQMVETNQMWEEAQIDDRQVARENARMQSLPEMLAQVQQSPMGSPMANPDNQQQAQMQMQQIMQPLPVNEWDNDLAHINGHERWMKTQEFEMMEPQFQQLAVLHLQEHKNKVMMQQMQMGVPGGAPPGPPEPQGALPPGGNQ